MAIAKNTGIAEKRLRFESLTIDNGLSQGMINCILQDRYGFMWFATKDGLNRYDGYNFVVYKHDPSNSKSISDNYINWVFEDSKGRFWIGTASRGLDLFDRNSETFQHFTVLKNSNSITNNQIQSIGEDENGMLWIICNNHQVSTLTIKNENGKAVFTFKKNAGDFISIKKRKIRYAANPNNDHLNKLVTATDTLFIHKAKLFSKSKSNIITKLLPENQNFDKYFSIINNIYQDASGVIWLGTKGYGILKYNSNVNKFHLTNTASVYFIAPMKNNNVLVNGGGKDYLQIYDKKDLTLKDWLNPDIPQFSNAISNEDGILDGALEEEDGAFWISKQQLINIELNSKKINQFPISKSSDFAFPIFLSSKKEVCFGSNNAFCVFNKDTKAIKKYLYPSNSSNDPYKFIQTIYEDKNHLFWLGTTDGLYQFNSTNQSWKLFSNDPYNSNSLSSDLIFTICPDPLLPDSFLWIGTNGGLNKFNMGTGNCLRFTEKNGLINNVVYGVLSDQFNNLWMSTNKGLARFSTSTNQFKNFEIHNGLQSNEFNRYAYCKTNDGTMFFGGINGFNYFNPNEIKDNTFNPQVQITDFKLNNQTVTFDLASELLTQPIYLTKKLTLDYKNNVITFDFAAFDFAAPVENKFQYKLVGFNNNWLSTNNNHSATYTNLYPGTYYFMVRGSNSDGVWSKNECTLKLVILPPWYMTWWFIFSMLLLLFLIIYSLYKYRLNEANKLHLIRNRIAADLHDEIGSTLSSISLFSEVVKLKSKTKMPEITPMLNRISSNIDEMMEAMNDIVWTINSHNDDFENILIRMRSNASELFEAKGYEFQFNFDKKLFSVKLGMVARKNVYLVFKEAINNIVKYANGTSVAITISISKNEITLLIEDNGIGFETTNASKGNGLNTMKKRATEINGKFSIYSKPGLGTKVKFSFPIT